MIRENFNLKVLGNITPFSWPKFARAQEEYAKKHPEKCTDLCMRFCSCEFSLDEAFSLFSVVDQCQIESY